MQVHCLCIPFPIPTIAKKKSCIGPWCSMLSLQNGGVMIPKASLSAALTSVWCTALVHSWESWLRSNPANNMAILGCTVYICGRGDTVMTRMTCTMHHCVDLNHLECTSQLISLGAWRALGRCLRFMGWSPDLINCDNCAKGQHDMCSTAALDHLSICLISIQDQSHSETTRKWPC